jgi:YHS domain-containing protein
VVNDKRSNTFKSLGKLSFKNVADEKEIFEIIPESRPHYYIDPVCRMIVYKGETSFSHPGNPELLFCSEGCRTMYLKTSN